ncbi:hypothetical protein BGW41_006381 [Actinomortierella wolfii]|nr:hypothetical protein BGW41_006381 [Actinomortierella wolfii]
MDRLQIGRLIGRGGYGSVFHAYWETQKAAIKICHVSQEEAKEDDSVQQEIELLKGLRNKHVIQYYGTTYHDNKLVLAMEYAEGGSLERAIRNRQLEWPDKKRIALEIARGLAYIHHKRVIHRDLKNMNVLLTRYMEAKICDFGMAIIKSASISKSSGATTLKGTYRWMAPELFTKRPRYTTKSDMYAFGMVMWEMAANCTKPFSDQLDTNVVITLVKDGEREDLPDDTPLDYRQWVERCWLHDPAMRPEACDMIIEEWDPNACDPSEGEDTTSSHPTLSISHTDTNVDSTDTVHPSPHLSHGHKISTSRKDLGVLISEAKSGDVEAQVTLAEKYYIGDGVDQDYSASFEWYRRAADHENAFAQIRVGEMLSHGQGTPQNDVEAVTWFRKLAEQGYTYGQVQLGVMYRDGRGVEQNYIEALSWFRKAAEEGDADGQAYLGAMYHSGDGVEQNYTEALAWFRKAAEQGNADAQACLGAMYYEGNGVEKDYTEAVLWLHKAAEQDYTGGQLWLGTMYRDGLGVDQNYIEAISLFSKAAEQGNVDAQVALGRMYHDGVGVDQSYIEALSWFRKAADQGDARGQVCLGEIYRDGKGVDQDYIEAVSLFRKAAEQGFGDGQVCLGTMYEGGLGVPKDTSSAISWYKKAVEQGSDEAQRRLKHV